MADKDDAAEEAAVAKAAAAETAGGKRRGTLFGVSVGPGDPELLTLKAVRVIQACQVIAAPHQHGSRDLARDIAAAAVDLSGKRVLRLPFSMSRDARARERARGEVVGLLIAELAAGRDVALLNLGDVGIYSTFGHIRAAVARAGFAVESIPGVPSFCAVAARLGTSLTAGPDEPLHVIPAVGEHFAASLELPGSLVVMKAGRSLGEVKRALAAAGRAGEAALVSDCGLPTEKVVYSLDEARDGDSDDVHDGDSHAAGGDSSADSNSPASYFTTLVVGGR